MQWELQVDSEITSTFFVDIDGVCCLTQQYYRWNESKGPPKFDRKAKKQMNELAQLAPWMMSTSWRNKFSQEGLETLFHERGIEATMIGATLNWEDDWINVGHPRLLGLNTFDDLPEEEKERDNILYGYNAARFWADIRTREILWSVKNNNFKRWIAIDDLPLNLPPIHFARTPLPLEGIKQCGKMEEIKRKWKEQEKFLQGNIKL